MKTVVTGGCGFIGSHLVDRLVGDGHDVVVIDNLATGNVAFLNPRATFYCMDVRDNALADVFARETPETVFHLAAQVSVRASMEDPKLDTDVNVIGTLNVAFAFLAAATVGPRTFVFSSTGGAMYGETAVIPTPETAEAHPLSAYGISKLAAEMHLRHLRTFSGLRPVALRYANVYGPRQNAVAEAGVVAIFITKMLAEEACTVYDDGLQTRDFIFVSDVVDANIAAAAAGAGGAYNIGTGVETSVNDLFSCLAETLGGSRSKRHETARPGEVRRSCLDARKAADDLGWKPRRSLANGLRETVGWFRK